MKKMTRQRIAIVKTKIKIKTPTYVVIIDPNGDPPVEHPIETPEDLEATLMIAQASGWKVKHNNKYIVE